MQVQLPCVFAANDHRKSVIKSKRGTERQAEPAFITLLHPTINFLFISARRFFENGGQSGARVLRIEVDSSRKNCLMTDESPRQIKTALDFQMSTRFDNLREHLAENQLLSKILTANDDAISIAGATQDRQKENEDQQATGDRIAADLLRNAWQAASLLRSHTQSTQPPLKRPQSHVSR